MAHYDALMHDKWQDSGALKCADRMHIIFSVLVKMNSLPVGAFSHSTLLMTLAPSYPGCGEDYG
jgi:hypothetical protein